MTSLDVLFWLLILLLCGAAWAIEAGLAARHRRVLMASTLSAFASIVFIMFWIEDESSIDLGPKVTYKRKVREPAEDADPTDADAEAASSKGPPVAAAPESGQKKEDGPPEYSMEPFRDCPLCPEIVIVTPKDTSGDLKPYAVGRLSVLHREFAAFVKATGYASSENCDIQSKRRGKFSWRNPGFEQDARHPVVCLSPLDAEAYVTWLSETTSRSYRLLTESEREYASRAGTSTPYWQGDSIEPTQANFGHFRDGTIAAGSLPANKFGLSDMNGNVWEILQTCEPLKPRPGGSKLTDDTCTERILKGGAWNSPAEQLRYDAKLTLGLMASANFVGIRVARSVDSRDKAKILSKAKKAQIEADNKAAAEIEAKAQAAEAKAERERLEAVVKAREAPPPAKK